jgi:predicted phosphodiesterase
MPKITFIGDVHGRIPEYLEIIKGCEYSIQLGDMGLDYSLIRNIDPERHQFVPGNHDNYRDLSFRFYFRDWEVPLCAGSEYGLHDKRGYGTKQFAGMFVTYIRGGYSIDRHLRTPGVDWFDEEELSYTMLHSLPTFFNLAMIRGPRFTQLVVSHECPAFLVSDYPYLRQGDIWEYSSKPYQPSRTAQALEKAWKDTDVKPKVWVFGHHHVAMDEIIDGTRFICVPELGTVELEFKSNKELESLEQAE